MNIVELIEKKKHKKELSKEELKFIVDGYVSGELPDYQVSALTMAIWFNGLTAEETANYTEAMMNSGDVIDLSSIEGIKVDKHSTGGVGDKVTLIVAPLVAAAGAPVAKMSGRGLGFTGGTIDKLEAIPGYEVERSIDDFIKQVNEIGVSVIGQTANLVPGDKKFYALRDVTASVDSVPLISASIMSKKLATGSNAILLDVKTGDGAFMKTYKEAEVLGKTMIEIGKQLGRDVKVEITSMSKPLGKQIGNKNEVLEAIEVLSGKGHEDIVEVCLSSAATMLVQANKFNSYDDAKAHAQELIDNGSALEKFKEWVAYQNGDVEAIFKDDYWTPKHKVEIKATENGFMNILTAVKFGLASVDLGAGRHTKEDVIDFDAGITINKKTNEEVQAGDVIFTLYSSSPIEEEVVNALSDAYEITKKKTEHKVILGKLS